MKRSVPDVSLPRHRPEETDMSKAQDQKKNVKKKAAKSFDEKRAAKKAKKAERSFLQKP